MDRNPLEAIGGNERSRGAPLDARLRADMERGLDADFGAVRVHSSAAVRAAVRAVGARALTVESHIVLGFPSSTLASPGGRLVLAHELAHVVQNRLGDSARRVGAPDAVEREAAWAALRVCAGATARCRVPGDATRVSAWGEVGHFYTVYFVMLAVGMPPKDAQRIAFYTQFPDEVEELDAYTIGVRYMKGKVVNSFVLAGAGDRPGPTKEELELWAAADAALKDSLHIQRGLHALTGANAEDETRKRTAILEAMRPSDADFIFDFGLALHPYGDSFAHRRGGSMFKPPIGHGLAGNAPDVISLDNQNRYLRYVAEMYEVAADKAPPRAARLSQEDTVATLRRLCAAGSALNVPQPLQAAWIRQWSGARMRSPMSDYDPLADDVVPFAEFVNKTYSRLAGVQARHFDRAIALSRKWA